jgi:hypothetical protein
MPENFARRMWRRVQSWFVANAEHVSVVFIPADDAEPLLPHTGYVRLWVSEGFLAQQRTWGVDRFPALHGGVSLDVLGAPATFTIFARPPEAWAMPGAQLDFRITTLLPYTGGTVELEAALYQASSNGPLGTAVELISGLASLMGPPLATAAAVADKVSDGLKKASKGAGKPEPGFRTLGIRVTNAYADWLARAAKHSRSTIATFLDRAAATQAKLDGFDEPPPERLP